MRLYEIPVEAELIEQDLAQNFGELTPEIEQRIAAFLADGKDKIEAAAKVVKSLEGDAAKCKEEAARLAARAAGLDRSIDRLQGLMIFAIDQGFGGKMKTSLFTIWAQDSAKTVSFELKPDADIYKVAELAPDFVRTPTPELNKVALKDALIKGAEIPDAISITENPGTRFLRIR